MSGVALKVSEGNNYVGFGVAGDGGTGVINEWTFSDCTTDPAVQSAHGSGETMRIENSPTWYSSGCCLVGSGAVSLGTKADPLATNIYKITTSMFQSTGGPNTHRSICYIVDENGDGFCIVYITRAISGAYSLLSGNKVVNFEEVNWGYGGFDFYPQGGEDQVECTVTIWVDPNSPQATIHEIRAVAPQTGRVLGNWSFGATNTDNPTNAATQIIHSTKDGAFMGYISGHSSVGAVEGGGGIYGGGAPLHIHFPHDVKISGIYWPPSVPIVVPGGAPVQIYMPIGPDPILGTPNDSRLQWTRTILLDPHRINTGFIP